MADENFDAHPHRPLLVAVYRRFRSGDFRGALDLLEPVIEHQELANRASVMAGVLWGLAGDCYFRLKDADKGFRANRRAIELDGETGCLPLFACQVALHQRVDDAEAGLAALRAHGAVSWRALRSHPTHFLWHSLDFYLFYSRFVRFPIARWRLRRLLARSKGGTSA